MTTYKKMIYLSQKEANFINKLLTNEPENEEECFGEDMTITHTARFSNGFDMDIKLCGVQYEEGGCNTPWTEAVLFGTTDGTNYHEVSCTDVGEEYMGEWEMEYNGDKYITVVKAVA